MLRFFSIIAYLEGVSYLVILFNMLVIKRMNNDIYHTVLFPVGMAHGVLFIAYIILAILLKFQLKWSYKKLALILLASFIPFGTFYSDKHWLHRNI